LSEKEGWVQLALTPQPDSKVGKRRILASHPPTEGGVKLALTQPASEGWKRERILGEGEGRRVGFN